MFDLLLVTAATTKMVLLLLQSFASSTPTVIVEVSVFCTVTSTLRTFVLEVLSGKKDQLSIPMNFHTRRKNVALKHLIEKNRIREAMQQDLLDKRLNLPWGERPPYREPYKGRAPKATRKKIAVICSREFDNIKQLVAAMQKHALKYEDPIILLDDDGPDNELLVKWSSWNWCMYSVYRPDTYKYGKSAGRRRHETMIRDCNRLIAFWDGEDPVTESIINLAKEQGKKVFIINV